jgi:hypothetical protein
LREFRLWSSKVWPVLGSSRAICVTKFNPWRRGTISALSILGLRTHLGWFLPLS